MLPLSTHRKTLNYLARCFTKWNEACDKRLARWASADSVGDLSDSKSNATWNAVSFLKPRASSSMLDLQEANSCITHYHRSRNYLIRCWLGIRLAWVQSLGWCRASGTERSVAHAKPGKTKSLMADKMSTESIDSVPPNLHISSKRTSLLFFF